MTNHKTVKPIFIAQRVPEFFPGINPRTLANLNSKGKGPTPLKLGRLVIYRFKELTDLFNEGSQ
jgi:hypothetical protein